MKLDIIIPCYNAAQTLERAVHSCLIQSPLNQLWLIDDASEDNTWHIIQNLAHCYPNKIIAQRLNENGGAARTRNWAAIQTQAELIAFLDADDAYQTGALNAAYIAMQQMDYLGLVRLRLQAMGLPEHYAQHPNINRAWHTLMMTVAGNTVFRRAFFLACGGFPQHTLFQRLGGEDGALGMAIVGSSVVGTLFDPQEPAVLHYWHPGIHAERLLNAHLLQQQPHHISQQDLDQANQITMQIQQQLRHVQTILTQPKQGVMPIIVSRT